jgi:hypothetical protein
MQVSLLLLGGNATADQMPEEKPAVIRPEIASWYVPEEDDLPPLMEPVSINRVSMPMARPCPLAAA